MSVGTIVAHGRDIVRSDPWKRMLLPVATEVARVHVMVVVMPFLALIAWAALGESYQPVVIVLLMAAFYLLPDVSREARGLGSVGVGHASRFSRQGAVHGE